MDLLQEYKELYYKEIEHSERLNSKIATCITFLTILGSAQILLWTQFKNFQLTIFSKIYFVMCIISCITFIVCLIKFYYAYSGYKYNYFPIRKMAEAITKTYEIAGDNKKDIKKADKHIYNMFCERYLNDAITNSKNNEIKNNKQKRLISYICISFVTIILTFSLGVGIDYFESKKVNEHIQHVIIEGGELNVR